MKGKIKQMVSGFLAMVTLASTVIQPITVSAAQLEPKKEVPALFEEVKELLDEDEVVTASDYEMEVGYHFDAKTDFSGICIPDNEKVKVTFEEAVNEQGESFDSSHADTCCCC